MITPCVVREITRKSRAKESGCKEKDLISSGKSGVFARIENGIQWVMRLLMAVSTLVIIGLVMSLSGCYGCGRNQNPEELREKTAAATAQLKQDARAVAQGIKEGWSRDRPLDLNGASAKDLASLPGISEETAKRIIANRPYSTTNELIMKRVITRQQYDKIAEQITVKKGGARP